MMNPVTDKPGIVVASAIEVVEMEDKALAEKREVEDAISDERIASSIASHIQTVFQHNKDARISSGIEKKMLQSLRAYNGHYDPEDTAKIKASGGSDIYMNLTPTKCRAAMSWLRDIFLAAKEKAWSLEPTPLPEIPKELSDKIRAELEKIAQASMGGQQQQEQSQGQPTNGPMKAAQTMSDTNQMKKDIEDAFRDQVYQLASAEVKKYEEKINDQLVEGEWEKALTDFIEDFCVFQVAIMKAPVISKKKKLKWVEGIPKVESDYVFLNKRVSPLDIYPSPSATDITDGDLCEHIRYSKKDIYDMIGVEGYDETRIRRVLDEVENGTTYGWIDTHIEDEKVTEEYRGDTYRANKGVINGIHFFGLASYSMLKDWGLPEEDLGFDENKEFEIEAILVGSEVIKLEINDDPLLRRPYYKSSFQNIPGSWWGRSLPELMRDIQRMCNATARALSNNMGLASGPQIELYIDRLAADEEIDAIHPLKVWQLTSDPTGAGGRAIQFTQPTSNAGELLAVYKEFELRADDATGIPRYAYGNERTGGAAQTASGLSMLLESASKGIKDAARHIDNGLIKPRVEYQFYWNMLSDPDENFTGDVSVVPKGSQALTMKGSQEMRRNEFLGILANPTYQAIVGMEGIAEILREMAKSLGLGENIIPSRIELKKRQAEQQAQQQQMQQMQAQQEQEKNAVGVQQVQMQTQQAEQASQRSAQIKIAELQQKADKEEKDRQLKAIEMEQQREIQVSKNTASLQKQQMQEEGKANSDNKNIALSIKSNYQDKSNVQ